MKRMALLVAALATMAGILAVPGTASATATAPVATCLGHTLLDQNGVFKLNTSVPWGVVNLCRDGDYYFAQFVHWDANREQAPMPAGFYGNAWIFMYRDGVYETSWNCDSPGGNKRVIVNQTWCVTPRIPSTLRSITFIGGGYVYRDVGGTWVKAAEGLTARCNKYIC